jgi:uncharacterized protein YggU (UPF0235/DUF167 family)
VAEGARLESVCALTRTAGSNPALSAIDFMQKGKSYGKWRNVMFDLFDYQNPPITLRVKVTPKAKSERIKKEITADGSVIYKIYVTVAPEDGKANAAVIKLLAKTLGIAKSSLRITHGLTSREKTIKINP